MKALKISKVILYFICVVFVILLLFVYIFLPTYQKTANLKSQHSLNLTQISFYTQKISNIKSVNKSIESKKETLEKNQELPGIDPLKVGEDLNTQLKKSGVKTENITVGSGSAVKGAKKSTDGKTLYVFPISLTVSCQPEQFDSLLNSYETGSDAMYYINSAELDYSESNKSYTGKIDMNMYCCLNEKNYKESQSVETNGK